MATMASAPTSISDVSSHAQGAHKAVQQESPGSARSRSTSAGSSSSPSTTLPDINYPSPLMVRNTFVDYPQCPSSWLEFLKEREVQSCPNSGIGAPPGLEHLASVVDSVLGDEDDFMPIKPDAFPDDSPQKIGPVDFGLPPAPGGLPAFDYPSPLVVRNTFLDEPNMHQFGSLADFIADRQARSCPASGIGMPAMPVFPSGVSSGFSSGVDGQAKEAMADALSPQRMACPEIPAPPAFEPNLAQVCLPTLPPAPCTAPLPPPPPAAPPALSQAQLATPPGLAPPPPAQAPQLRIAESLPDSSLGTPDMPTVGSAGHRFGTCKPCAFFHTKGCGTGVNCTFCHLCAPGEKKRRQKIKHTACKISANLAANGMDPMLARNAAAHMAAARATTQTASVYRA
eukprot:TRINITY_DN61842_c0_g1_i1.p1 TRINITY_DN61842_c0_g1~~TRINITY_DN61842_c0_g1_i1.p1  ORF type:complete len:420 (-),score=77.63 TRINITY_DN61842_c0_g1_i1:71-1264(-)